ncbi:hypothetical protein [Gluconobacter oxydans]|uniref:hypothetical protein n=1 Tax=Gluconobacter oxydans TaxID=442 RepID=UPI0012DA0DF5|nr:hypothetical protein [Gluconobacter oxydans]
MADLPYGFSSLTVAPGWRFRPVPASRKEGAFLDFNVVFGFRSLFAIFRGHGRHGILKTLMKHSFRL